MIGVLLLLQSSTLVRPMYMDPEPPEARALHGIRIVHKDVPGMPPSIQRTREEALAEAQALIERLRAGEEFPELARRHSAHPTSTYGGNWGTTWPGMFPEPIDSFLYSAEVGAVSEPLDMPSGVHIVQRVERDAAWRLIKVDGVDAAARERCSQLLARIEAGEDFAELAKAESDDPLTKERGGLAGIHERHPRDAVLRAAGFALDVGEVGGPVETPFALYLVQRVPVEGLDPTLREDNVARVRAILIMFSAAEGAPVELMRSLTQAGELALALYEEIEDGRDMGELALVHNDDPGGRERRGDLGWVRRGSSDVPQFMEKVFLEPKGKLLGPIRTNAGWVIVRRER